MPKIKPNLKKIPAKGWLIPHIELSGPKQMALDTLLLKNSFTDHKPTPSVRFYSWDGPWLSIGKNQRIVPDKLEKLAKEKRLSRAS